MLMLMRRFVALYPDRLKRNSTGFARLGSNFTNNEFKYSCKWILAALVPMTLMLFANTTSATVLYSNDFDGAVVTVAGVTATLTGGSVEGVQGYSDFGFSGSFYRNASAGDPATPTSLTLTGIGAHTKISIAGLLAVIDSWDSTDGSCCSPDLLDVIVDGVSVLTATFNNAVGTVNTVFGTQLTPGGSSGVYPNLGFSLYHEGQAFDFTGYTPLTGIAHTSSTLNIQFLTYGTGWQGGSDESYAIENLLVTAIPEPSTALLLGIGLSALAATSRRRSS